jgi:hypothetical protein
VSERSEQRNAEARARLRPLAPGERPTVVTVAAVVAVLIAGVNLLLTALADDADGGEWAYAIGQAIVLLVIAVGMLQRRYLAVLAFEALLGFQILQLALGALLGDRLVAQLVFAVALVVLGYLFWKLIPALARLQMPGPHGER